jgi:hypothetical protein
VLVPNTIATIIAYALSIPPEHLWWTSIIMVTTTVVATIGAYIGIMSKFTLYSTPEEKVEIGRGLYLLDRLRLWTKASRTKV